MTVTTFHEKYKVFDEKIFCNFFAVFWNRQSATVDNADNVGNVGNVDDDSSELLQNGNLKNCPRGAANF